jgi:4-hydroxy-tetrahydrodipicolinate synthase
MKRIGGMFANLPTPFSRDGSRIDFAVVRERIEWLVEAGVYARIQGVCNVVVTKDGAGDVFRVSEVRARCPRTMAYLCGTEYQSLPALVLGADGCCNAINSVVPEQVVAIYDAVQAGDLEAARERFQKLQPLYTFIRVHGVARTTKAAAELLGVSFGPHRPPLQALSGAAAAKLVQALREAGARVR